jgi:hypothetical protein
LARNHPRHFSLLSDDDFGRLNVTLNVPIDLQRAPANDPEPLANNREVIPDDGFLAARRRGEGPLYIVRTRLRFGLGR